jgi:cytochrome P450 / NADPH-cytochrome P450 reductase
MTIALILQRFQVTLVEPDYQLKVRQTLTIKPTGWHMKVRLRPGKDLYTGIIPKDGIKKQDQKTSLAGNSKSASDLSPLTIFYGSNQGTCKTFAESIQSEGPAHGFQVALDTLDAATENIPTDRPVIFIAPSYEGQPPDNGKRFVAWLEAHEADKDKLKGVKYAVFGLGNPDWVNTFNRIPKLIDRLVSAEGATMIVPTVLGNVSQDIFGTFDDFTDNLWKTLSSTAGKKGSAMNEKLKLEVTLDRPELLGEKQISLGTVRRHVQLAKTSVGPEKRLMEVELPDEMSYQCGDYLVVLPTNRAVDVRRILTHFGIAPDVMIKLSGTNKTFLPTHHPEYAYALLTAYLEIETMVSRKQLQAMAEAANDEKQKAELQRLGKADVYDKQILPKRPSVIDILLSFPSVNLDFAAYIDMLQPMKPRQYSIASSPLASAPGTATIVYDVLDAPSFWDHAKHFHGVASTYLRDIPVGGKVHCYAKPTNTNFRLPFDNSVPVIMVCAGTGLAPMRGFIQERAAILATQPKTEFGKALLYFGCRDPEKDYICRSELEEWEKQGVVELRPAFSQKKGASEGYKHVPDR